MGNKFGKHFKKKKKGETEKKAVKFSSDIKGSQVSENFSDRVDGSSKDLASISAKYSLGKRLGKGHFAIVRLATNIETGEKVAIKCIQVKHSHKQKETLKKEIHILQTVGQHNSITSIYDVYLTGNELHIVMELCEGGELFDRLVTNGPYSEESARLHMRNVVDALDFLHSSKIIHRDLKPENIMLKTKNDPESALRLADFGLGRLLDEQRSARTVCGTWAYTAPEVTSRAPYDYKADMFSFGVILYVILSAYHPFDPEVGSSDSVIIQRAQEGQYNFDDEEWTSISDEAKDLIRKLLAVHPKDRLSARECLEHPWMASVRKTTPLRSQNTSIDHALQKYSSSCKERWHKKVVDVKTELSVLKHMSSFGSAKKVE